MRPAGPAPGAVPAGWRSAGSGWRCCGHSGSARNSSGAPTISALELTSGGYPRPGGAASGPLAARAGPLPLTPTPWAARWSWPSAPRAARTASSASLLAPVRLAGRLGRPTPGDPLAVLWQEPRQAGAQAARPLDRPAATAGQVRVGEAQQPLVAGRVGAGGGLGQHAAEVGDGGGGQGACGGCRRRRAPSMSSASMAIAVVLLV